MKRIEEESSFAFVDNKVPHYEPLRSMSEMDWDAKKALIKKVVVASFAFLAVSIPSYLAFYSFVVHKQ